MNVSVIIPSLNPDDKLIKVVDSLIEYGFEDIILVNDGSDQAHMEEFNYLEKYSECQVLTHEVNKGKGRALKTAFDFCIANRLDIDGVVTVDGDNQHKAKDIFNCVKAMKENENNIILGVRDFKGENVPAKSRIGNIMTSFVFKFACGLNISDTQTGLRAIPRQYLQLFSEVKGERFEYETNMLLEFKHSGLPYKEVKIETVYIEENASTHFNPIKDSIKIYGVIFKFLFSSIMSSVIDLSAFSLFSFLLFNRMETYASILIATISARVISSLFNFSFNRKAVFKSQESIKNSIVRYYILCVCQLLVSYGLVYFATTTLSLGKGLTVVSKAIIDTILFMISFRIQRKWVFK